jgi:class 3 adenylate cyclase
MIPTTLHTLVMKAPVTRRRSRLVPGLLFASLLGGLIIPASEIGVWPWIGLTLKFVAALCGCSLAHSLEHLIHYRFRHNRWPLRIVIAAAVPLAGLIAGVTGVYLVGIPLRSIGDGATALITVLAAMTWLLSACGGSLLVLVLDRLIRPFSADFQSRLNLAVLALAGMTAFLAYLAAQAGQNLLIFQGTTVTSMFKVDLGFGPVWSWNPAQLSVFTESSEFMTQAYFGFLVVIALPAVMSASGKLSESLMSNLEPLQAGFEAVASGELDFRIPESGTKDFAKLNRTFNQMIQSLNLAKRMEHAFGSYVSEEILDQIRKQHGEANLEPTLRMATVFFADIRGFTSLSERINPKQLLAVLNRFYEEVATVVQTHSGFLVQYIGDAVVVVFNGPMDQPHHADMAAACAIDIQRAVDRLNREKVFPEAGDLHIGIGLATGPLVAGNLGDSAHLLQYTVLGDTVNQAARLTGLTPPGAVYVNQRNSEMIDPRHDPQQLEAVKVKGRARKIVPHQVWPRHEFTDVTEVQTMPVPGIEPAEA